MYSDHRNAGREAWKYTYKASDLLVAAGERLNYWQENERKLREQIAKHATGTDPLTGSKFEKLRQQATTAGSFVEQLQVFVYEFKRNPDREYSLALGDVVFFGLAGTPAGIESDD